VKVHQQPHEILDGVVRSSRAKLVAFLAAGSGDLAAAEDALSEAFATALVAWPKDGCPANPEAWLLTVARRKLIDAVRRQREIASSEELEELATSMTADPEHGFPDQRLALLFACAHPAIDPVARAPLMLQAVLGLDAAQIANAFLVSPAAMAQRLVRAKIKIRDTRIPFRVPDRDELPERLDTVLNAIYACYAEGWSEAAGADPVRMELAAEAIFMGRLLAELIPDEPEAWGLLALMLFAEARRPARRNAAGEFVPLMQQNCTQWDGQMIAEAEAALRRASGAGVIGRFQLEAAIQSAHTDGLLRGRVEWSAILRLYDALVQLTRSPVAEINRAMVLAEVDGPQAGLYALDWVRTDKRVNEYQPYWAVRANLLARAGKSDEARHAYGIAIGLEREPAVRSYLQQLCQELRD
jgi:RNA polymerase sigma-70 factor, ECF subfamily